jgi:NAD+ diphosphatase
VITGRLEGLPLARGTHDRAASRRGDEQWLASMWADRRSRVLLVADGQTLVGTRGDAVEFLSPADLPDAAPLLLGIDDGVAYFLVIAEALPPDRPAAGLRALGGVLGERDAGLLVHAVALAGWHTAHPRCARCGGSTVPAQAGQSRRCESCEALHFPRSDPAVIMLATDADDRCLLGRQQEWPAGRFSTLAGFVEPGETPEHAVVREIGEEVGVQIGAVSYAGSQPWPFPASLMLGYFAEATSTDIHVDGTEITQAAWFTRAELRTAVDRGELLLPGGISIARALVERWYGGPLPSSW